MFNYFNGHVYNRVYNCGLYVGRFQPLHVGHTMIIDEMLKECKIVIVAVGSAQESGTERNPLSFELRKELIYGAFDKDDIDRIVVLPINDRETYSDDSSWGDYLLNQVYEQCHLRPDVIYEGEEDVRTHWYDNCDILVLKVPRTILKISGTELRQAIIDDRELFARIHIPYRVYGYYDLIRKEIQNAGLNKKCD